MNTRPVVTENPGSAGASSAVSRASRDTSAREELFGGAPNSAGEGARAPRILMTADTIGGVWTYALELARALPQIDFVLATMGAPVTPAQRTEAAALPNITLMSSSYALEWMDEPWGEVDRAGEWLLEIAREFAPDIVHLNGYAHAALPWSVPVVVVAHSCVLSWWPAVRDSGVPERYAEYRKRVTSGLNAADLVIAPTLAMLATLRSNYSFVGAGEVIPNARDQRLFSRGAKREVIFSAGRFWDEAKNLATLEAAAPKVKWPVEVAGDIAPEGIGFCSLSSDSVDAQKRVSGVRILGKLNAEQMAQQFSTAAIYALPARYEPFGLSALEAALSGCALVLGDIPSLREVWGDAALFVTPDDHHALATTLNRLIDDQALRHDLVQRAYERALTFSPTRMAESYLAAYAACLTTRPSEIAA